MAQKLKIKFDADGFRQLLTGQEVGSLVESKAREIADRAGGESEGFTVSIMIGGFGGGRHVAFVRASTYEAMQEEADNKRLTKAVI